MGDPGVDYDSDDRNASQTQPGFSPNTRTLLQIVVGPRIGAKDFHLVNAQIVTT